MKDRPCCGLFALVLFSTAGSLHAAVSQTNNTIAFDPPSNDLFVDFLRLLGAFAVVVGVFLVGAWCFRKSRLFSLYQPGAAQLKILETRSLGYRNSLFVVGYQNRRFLLAASSTGINLVSPLPDAIANESAERSYETFAERLDVVKERKP
ncbi:MAG: flagellar biosynthetic protein FliO [Verrucomicrobia bacterium]|nr:flagellar biosynthetic protein FliO [Verrucomicrobiota bacterium]